MATYLKQSTAVDIALGPFLDSTDGNTAETGLTISQADVRLKKNAGAWAQKNDANAATHEEAGWYECALNTTDTDTLGILMVAVHEAGALPVWREFMVVPANVYDSLVGGGDTLDVQVTGIGADVITSASIANNAITDTEIANGAITAAKFAADAITATVIADNAIDAGAIAANAITAQKIAADAIGNAQIAANAITADKIGTNAIDADALAADAVAEIQSGLATAASIASLDGKVDDIDATADAIKLKTDSLTFTVAGVLDGNIQRVNDVVVQGTGAGGDEWRPV